MSSLRTIKNKINTVKSIKKIFSVMQLIAASKMKKAQELVNSSNGVVNELRELFVRAIDNDTSVDVANELTASNESAPMVYIVFSSDRGLCGNYNSIITRKIQEILKHKKTDIKLITIGNKVNSALYKNYAELMNLNLGGKFDEFRRDETKITELLGNIFTLYKKGEISGCKVIYVFSKNAMMKEVRKIDFFSINELKMKKNKSNAHNDNLSDFEDEQKQDDKIIYEPNKSHILSKLLQYYLQVKFFNIFRNAYFSELASRMVAMDNASRNSHEIQQKLTLNYNKKRQAAITSDLIDIINGAENA